MSDTTPSDTTPAEPNQPLPTLSSHEAYQPQAKAAKVASTPPPGPSDSERGLAATMRRRRRIRARIKKGITLLVVLGILGGGAYAAKYYLLDEHWTDGYEALADEVAAARGIDFHEPVEVRELEAAEYGTQIFRSTMHVDEAGEDRLAGEWRALGLLTGDLDSSALGLTAAVDAPAFYDPRSATVYVISDLPTELRRFAVQRALTLALLDQEFGWGGRIADAAAAIDHGTTMLFDADALAVAESLLDTDARVSLLAQQRTLATAFGVTSSPAPFATALMARSGLAARSYVGALDNAARSAIEAHATLVDGQVLDLRRLVQAADSDASDLAVAPDGDVGLDAQGTLLWYHAFAARLDADTAWRVALQLQSDSVSVVSGTAGVCITGLLRFDPSSVDLAGAALTAWAATGPATSSTTASGVAGGQPGEFQVSACDPGASVDTLAATPRPSLGGAPLRSEQFRVLAADQPALSSARVACAVFGPDPITIADDRALLDALDGWAAPAAHPAPDPARTECAAL